MVLGEYAGIEKAPAPVTGRVIRLTAWSLIGFLIIVRVALFISWAAGEAFAADWWTLSQSAADRGTAALYDSGEYGFRWSPVAAELLVALPSLPVWTALHFAALALLRDWRLIVVALATAPFWQDVTVGNVIIFVVVAAYWALRGNRPATIAYLIAVLLMPRPLMLPVAAWLLWRQPWTRIPFAAMFLVHAALVAWTGLGDDWLRRLAESGGEIGHYLNWGPTALFGAAWIPVGVALAAWLTWQGRVGLASLAISPYLFPYYLLFGLLELGRLRPAPPARRDSRFPVLRSVR